MNSGATRGNSTSDRQQQHTARTGSTRESSRVGFRVASESDSDHLLACTAKGISHTRCKPYPLSPHSVPTQFPLITSLCTPGCNQRRASQTGHFSAASCCSETASVVETTVPVNSYSAGDFASRVASDRLRPSEPAGGTQREGCDTSGASTRPLIDRLRAKAALECERIARPPPPAQGCCTGDTQPWPLGSAALLARAESSAALWARVGSWVGLLDCGACGEVCTAGVQGELCMDCEPR